MCSAKVTNSNNYPLQQFNNSIYKANFVINRLVTVDTFAEGEVVVNLNDVVWNTQTKKAKTFTTYLSKKSRSEINFYIA